MVSTSKNAKKFTFAKKKKKKSRCIEVHKRKPAFGNVRRVQQRVTPMQYSIAENDFRV